MAATLPRVALVGATGFGANHLRNIARLATSGRIELVAVCDPRPTPDVPVGVQKFPDHRTMLDQARPDIAVVSTPPHTHLPIALDLIAAGVDLLLEKPPVAGVTEHDMLAAALADAGKVAQVGFQAQGSRALAALSRAITEGRLGTVTGIVAGGTWIRDDSYYQRSPWAGRRSHDGRLVLDGALVNPFAHMLMLGLTIAEAVTPGVAPVALELERYRCRDIEVDDTACVRVRLSAGPPVLVAVTLCASTFREGDVVVHGTAGTAVLEYATDRLALHPPGTARLGGAAVAPALGRVDLLENLLAHRTDPLGTPLIAPLDATRQFTVLAEAIALASPPTPVATDAVRIHGAGATRTVELTGVDAAIGAAVARLSMFSESGTPWARPPSLIDLQLDPGLATSTPSE
ncbi:Gfo/Idh/MocA family protein [Micromonospora sp. 067-2]|uniref:Gfo/Idh/MocA family protein n=1 Tax=Micromonospora sp. 067-2 TaxID=2789270 RepID=UPI00397C9C57